MYTKQFISGAICMGFAIAALFFVKFWRRTRDPLFFRFALAFGVLAFLRIPLTLIGSQSEYRPWLYVGRLLAFVLILWAIFQKNRGATQTDVN